MVKCRSPKPYDVGSNPAPRAKNTCMGYIAPPPPIPGESKEDYTKRCIRFYKRELDRINAMSTVVAISVILFLFTLIAALIVHELVVNNGM